MLSSPTAPPAIGFNLRSSGNGFSQAGNNFTPAWQANFGASQQHPQQQSAISVRSSQQQPPQKPLPAVIVTNNNGHSALSQLKSLPLGDDLIDLGQFDSKKILDLFDPLLSVEQGGGSDRNGTDLTSRNGEVRNSPNSSIASASSSSSSSCLPDRTSLPVLPSESIRRVSDSGTASIASKQQRHSLYPDLSEAVAAGTLSVGGLLPSPNSRSESPYSALQKELLECDESSIYDAYNPLEYLYAVSSYSSASSTIASEFYYATTSSYRGSSTNDPQNTLQRGETPEGNKGERRSIGFSHYFPDSVASIDPVPPALPPRNSEQASPSCPTAALRKSHAQREKEPEVQRRVRNSTIDRVCLPLKHCRAFNSTLLAFFTKPVSFCRENAHKQNYMKIWKVSSSVCRSIVKFKRSTKCCGR